MTGKTYRNVSFATAAGLRDLLARGSVLNIRGEETREIRNRVTTLERPRERCLFLPHRGSDIFASIAETFWVLAGRDDVEWLQRYLLRAPEFSDNGRTWRGAYGPRLRSWNGVDQLDATRQLLLHERLTRRAVMVLYDPQRDFVQSKDIPCNNWLHWLVRDERLHLNVAVRSNDIVWGFSGINSFEWSVLHEMMAFWIGMPVGEATYFASSFHVYKRHFSVAERVVAGFGGVTCYDFDLACPPFQVPWEDFNDALTAWFALEEAIRRAPELTTLRNRALPDPLMNGALQLLRVHWGLQRGWEFARLHEELEALPETDLTAAAYEYLGRKYPKLLEDIPHPAIAAFFNEYRQAPKDGPVALNWRSLAAAIKAMHRQKSAAYGDAWKRRGETASILANIARKVDRLSNFAATGVTLPDESIVDTAIDLLVYTTKYRLFLMDLAPTIGERLMPANASRPFCDHVSNFEMLIDQLRFPNVSQRSSSELMSEVAEAFEVLHSEASASGSRADARFELASRLSDMALLLIATLRHE